MSAEKPGSMNESLFDMGGKEKRNLPSDQRELQEKREAYGRKVRKRVSVACQNLGYAGTSAAVWNLAVDMLIKDDADDSNIYKMKDDEKFRLERDEELVREAIRKGGEMEAGAEVIQ